MSTMQAELYDALREAGASEGKARAAAEAAVASHAEAATKAAKETAAAYPKIDDLATKADLAKLETKLEGKINLIHWMVGFNLAVTVFILFKII